MLLYLIELLETAAVPRFSLRLVRLIDRISKVEVETQVGRAWSQWLFLRLLLLIRFYLLNHRFLGQQLPLTVHAHQVGDGEADFGVLDFRWQANGLERLTSEFLRLCDTLSEPSLIGIGRIQPMRVQDTGRHRCLH